MKLPVYGPRVWLRIALKVLVALIIFDVMFGLLHIADRLTAITIYGRLVPYHTRLVVADSDLGHQVMPLNILLKSHEISRPKGANEFRVVLLGESGIVGAGNSDNTTISAQITAAKETIHGDLIRAYNLGWPTGSVTRDLLIGDASLAYHPDLIVWFVTLGDFRNDNLDLLIEANSRRMTQLTTEFGLTSFPAQTFGHADQSWWSDTFLNQRATVYRWLRWQIYNGLRQPNFRVFPAGIIKQFPVPEDPLIKPDDPIFMPMPGPTWDALTVLPQLTSIPILIVNEPMYIDTTANNNYNVEVSKVAYDEYRATLNRFCAEHHLWCIDIWNAVPPEEYTDSDYHRTPEGQGIIAAAVVQEAQARLGPQVEKK